MLKPIIEDSSSLCFSTNQLGVGRRIADRTMGAVAFTDSVVLQTPVGSHKTKRPQCLRGFNTTAEWNARLDQLLAIAQLQDDWDGEGSPAPTQKLVATAAKFLQEIRRPHLAVPDSINASVNGTIYFEWYGEDGSCEVEIESVDRVELRFVIKPSGDTLVVEYRKTANGFETIKAEMI